MKQAFLLGLLSTKQFAALSLRQKTTLLLGWGGLISKGTTFQKIFCGKNFIKKYQPNKPTFPNILLFIDKRLLYGYTEPKAVQTSRQER